MRLSPLLLLALVCCPGLHACTASAPKPPVPLAVTPPVVARPEPPPKSLPPLDATLPAGSALTASVSTEKLDAIFGAALRGATADARSLVERGLHLAEGALRDGALISALGLDRSHPIVLSVGLVGGPKKAKKLRSLVDSEVPAGQRLAQVRTAFEGDPALATAVRAILPATEPGRVQGVLEGLLTQDRWRAVPAPSGIDEVLVSADHCIIVGMTRGASTLVVDLVLPVSPAENATVSHGLAALERLRARPLGGDHDDAPSLDGRIARLQYEPVALADVALVDGTSTVLRLLHDPNFDPEARDSIAERGFKNALISQKLASTQGEAYFKRIELSVKEDYGTLAASVSADPGPIVDLPKEPWAPTVRITVPGALAMINVSVPWIRSLATINADYSTMEALREAAFSTSWLGGVVAIPQLTVVGFDYLVRDATRFAQVSERAERVAVVVANGDKSRAFVAVFPPGTKPQELTCVLAASPPCPPAERIAVGRTTKVRDFFGRLVQVKGRWALVVSLDKLSVDTIQPDLAGEAGPAIVEFPGRSAIGPMLREAGGLAPLLEGVFAERYVGEVKLQGPTAILSVRSAAIAPIHRE